MNFKYYVKQQTTMFLMKGSIYNKQFVRLIKWTHLKFIQLSMKTCLSKKTHKIQSLARTKTIKATIKVLRNHLSTKSRWSLLLEPSLKKEMPIRMLPFVLVEKCILNYFPSMDVRNNRSIYEKNYTKIISRNALENRYIWGIEKFNKKNLFII